MSAALMAMRPTTEANSQNGSRASSRKSMFMPTVKKKRPSSSPLNGSMVVSIALRNSVSASSRPATNAPSAIDRPARPAATALPTITNRIAATNSSLVLDGGDEPEQRLQQQPADDDDHPDRQRRIGQRQHQPGHAPSRPGCRRGMETNSRIGTTARSWASRIEKLVRPAVVDRRRWLERTSMTMAVDDSARQAPMMMAAAGLLPASVAMPAITAAHSTTCSAAEPEHQTAHGDEALVGQLEPDQEQQEHDAELGDARDVLGVDHRDPVERRAPCP